MLQTDFSVDMSVWQDGVFQSAVVSKPAAEFEMPKSMRTASFTQALQPAETVSGASAAKTAETAPDASQKAQAPAAHLAAPVVLAAQNRDVQEIPAALADVEDLTPFIVSADSKPGSRLNEELKRTTFSNAPKGYAATSSPYNMSEEKAAARAQAREAAQAARTLRGPGDGKVFPMDSAARYNNNSPKFGVNQPLTSSVKQAEDLRKQQLMQAADMTAVKPVASNTTPGFQNAPVDVEAIRSQVSSGGYGYKREFMPSGSSEQTTPAASWFPEAMTRQLDAYEAMSKVAAQNGAVQTPTDIKA